MAYLNGDRVTIRNMTNMYAKHFIGKSGTVVGDAPLGMLALDLDDGTKDVWVLPINLCHAPKKE